MQRCINIDWLECYCLESLTNFPHDADYFRHVGFIVRERPYGTRVYQQMFTLLDNDGDPFMEVRRAPYPPAYGKQAVIDPCSCHLRLVNRYCYFANAAQLMEDFINKYGFTFSRISRVDVCLDFERFDSGDDPQKFITRYLKHRFAKINQGWVNAHGEDRWDSVTFNSLSWGASKSMVRTKLYNKSLELRQAKDKPYIKQCWARHGFYDDLLHMTKTNGHGVTYQPDIWRLEFSLASTVKGWLTIENQKPGKDKYLSIRNTLDCYKTKENMLKVFSGLQRHYFYFVYFDNKKKKYDCKPKELFRWSDVPVFYSIDRPYKTVSTVDKVQALIKRMEEYKLTCIDYEKIKAAECIIEDLKNRIVHDILPVGAQADEKAILQALIGLRINKRTANEPISDTKNFVEALLNLEDEIY